MLAAALLAAAPALAEDGEALFEIHCAACHNTGGTGNPGLAPPLDRPAFWQGLGEAAPEYLAGVMVSGLNGTLVVEGQTYAGLIMPPVAGTTDEELAEIGTWVLGTLGETGSALGVEEIAAARETRPSHADLRAMRPAE
ncbi:Cytochrome C oxidase, cbb3-type, subunit III [Celeribacter indicus]|uniref:Cytochrome c-552 n=1 Tax=Celeribacter indicus TaxID=1208324 RepID=A0A0B5DYG4_9RHOB|nr:cytochrome c-552 [Celeribacter indicus]SDW30808.1 Cytochrome C oxidase, cbb3-type, subunit III [Celeribacter indicus]